MNDLLVFKFYYSLHCPIVVVKIDHSNLKHKKSTYREKKYSSLLILILSLWILILPLLLLILSLIILLLPLLISVLPSIIYNYYTIHIYSYTNIISSSNITPSTINIISTNKNDFLHIQIFLLNVNL